MYPRGVKWLWSMLLVTKPYLWLMFLALFCQIFIYFWRQRFGNLKSHFQEFQELMNKYAKELCICNSNLMVFNFQQFRQISIKFSVFSQLDLLRTIFVLSINCKYGISPNNGNLKRAKGSEVFWHVIEPISWLSF